MSKYCPAKDGPALYLDCQECDDRICEKEIERKVGTVSAITTTIIFNNPIEMSAFLSVSENLPFDVDIVNGKYVGNGKSLLNMLSMNVISVPVTLKMYTDKKSADEFLKKLHERGFAMMEPVEEAVDC